MFLDPLGSGFAQENGKENQIGGADLSIEKSEFCHVCSTLRSSRPDISSILANFIDFWNLLGTGKLPQMMPIDFIEDFSRLSRIERSLQRGYEKSAQEGK